MTIGLPEAKFGPALGAISPRRGAGVVGQGPVTRGLDALAAECRAALVVGARSEGATRQRARASARRFVRRHRRDASYLLWVLRSVAASSALAVALLGLDARPASADAPRFGISSTLPVNILGDSGDRSYPAFGDLDGDGDLDVVVGDYDGTFSYYENLGDRLSPAYVLRAGGLDPFDGLSVLFTQLSAPALGDLDGDGDLDLVAGGADGSFSYFQNTGDQVAPVFTERTGAQNPLDFADSGTNATPALGDVDGDGDLDMVVGDLGGGFRYYQNNGSASAAAFDRVTGAADPFDGKTVDHGYSTPGLADIDRDGDLDLIAGTYRGETNGAALFAYWENEGDATQPLFVRRPGAANPLNGQGNFDLASTVALGDLDGDGDADLLSGRLDGAFTYLEDHSGTFGGALSLPQGDVGFNATPALGDLDGDGDLDVVSGEAAGTFLYYENMGSQTNTLPIYIERTGAENPLDGESIAAGRSAPTLGDLDGDGDLDLVSGSIDYGAFFYYENTGTPRSPAFTPVSGAENPVDGLGTASSPSSPELGDVDGDGDLDLLAGSFNGDFLYWENIGDGRNPTFALRTGAQNPMDGVDLGRASSPALGDVDRDGDLDLVAGEDDASFFYFENTGSPTSPVFVPRTGEDNPLGLVDLGLRARPSPTLGDVDGDGDLDLISGQNTGTFGFYQNWIVEPTPAYVEQTGEANPLAGAGVGGPLSAPALVDLDGDGDLDLFSGDYINGSFAYYENTGDATTPVFVKRTGGANPLDQGRVGFASTPAFGRLQGTAPSEPLSGALDGMFYFAPNQGSATNPNFPSLDFGPTSPLGFEDVGDESTPALADIDGDGDVDLVSGEAGGAFVYYENTGDVWLPAFVLRAGGANPLNGFDVGDASAPAFGDVDGDADLDIVVGEYSGTLFYYENTGDAIDPVFVARTGSENPFDGIDVGFNAKPALGDLNGDGLPDLVTGEFGGTFRTYYTPVKVPEPSPGLLGGAALILLGWLRRPRRKP